MGEEQSVVITFGFVDDEVVKIIMLSSRVLAVHSLRLILQSLT